ncbi:MAG: dephospho-CoA kinase [Oligoflexales bacterium]|nr:dephospho-CoA kinase [Oligoflexales bacterium]
MSLQSESEKQTGKVIGLTGGIAAGKSTAAKILKQLGCIVLDADKLGHEAYLKCSSAYKRILENFGPEILDPEQAIDRKKLGSLVFTDRLKLKLLCDIVWPEIKKLGEQRIKEARKANPLAPIVLEAAVLLEAEWESIVDEVWVVYIEPELAIQRMRHRNQLSADEAKARLQAQMTNSERLKKADKSYENNADTMALEQALKRMLFGKIS